MDQSSLCYPCHSRPPRENSAHEELLDAYRTYLVQARGVFLPEPHIRVAACFFALLETRGRRLEEMSAADNRCANLVAWPLVICGGELGASAADEKPACILPPQAIHEQAKQQALDAAKQEAIKKAEQALKDAASHVVTGCF